MHQNCNNNNGNQDCQNKAIHLDLILLIIIMKVKLMGRQFIHILTKGFVFP